MSQGNGRTALLTFTHPPKRVVSLVPSMTESLFDLDLGESLVGVTDYCLPPPGAAERLTRVGGTRSPDVEAIAGLKPDLVIANMEENSKPAVEALERAGLKVWVTFPRTVQQALELLWALVGLFRVKEPVAKIKALENSLEWTERAAQEQRPVRVFCPIWAGEGDRWLMTFNRDTYAHDLLARCGGENVFGDRERRYPLAADLGEAEPEPSAGRDTRYPRVTLEEIRQAAPEVILFPSEPYAFGPTQVQKLSGMLEGTPAARAGRVHQVDGSLITWHGTRLGRALAELPGLLVTNMEA
jgi:ABC-type Fe3+-hydroxamate transport system substrate-binding protein